MTVKQRLLTCLGTLLLPALSATAHEGQSELVEELIIYGRAQQMLGIADSASEGIVGFDDITLPPLLRVGELAEAVPGMVATQHSGTGKANQYFLRGFNLDHGTDFSAFANGVPINMRTHGHGQGYLDLNFLIPELVATTAYRKGPYSVLAGDFSSAGSVSFDYYDRLEEAVINATVGENDYYRTLVAGSFDAGNGYVTGALDLNTYRGPWELDEDLRTVKFHTAYNGHIASLGSKVSISGYSGSWNASDQIPKRAVEAGLIDRFGFIDDTLGGTTDRYDLTLSLDADDWRVLAYVVDYDFSLYSNFTYLLDNPQDGDQFEQTDRRTIYGARIDGRRALDWSSPVEFGWGADMRYDDIREVGLFRTVERSRRDTLRNDAVDELSLSAYSELAFSPTESLRATIGLRADYFDWDVSAFRAENSGQGNDLLVSPKANLAYRINDAAELYLNWGRGFHSNDVRGATITVDPITGLPADPVDPLVKSDGAEIGMRFEKGDAFNAAITLFSLELDSELLFVGDAGNTEVNGATERLGVEFTTFWQATPWLAANFTYTYTDSKYKEDFGDGTRIPGAVESSALLGLNSQWQNGVFASLRVRYLGEAPLIEDNSVRSRDSLLVNGGIGYRWKKTVFRLDGFNLLNAEDNDISYYYASRLPGEPADGIEDIHFKPLEPRTVRASVTWHF